jgi:hypothetical protein
MIDSSVEVDCFDFGINPSSNLRMKPRRVKIAKTIPRIMAIINRKNLPI